MWLVHSFIPPHLSRVETPQPSSLNRGRMDSFLGREQQPLALEGTATTDERAPSPDRDPKEKQERIRPRHPKRRRPASTPSEHGHRFVPLHLSE